MSAKNLRKRYFIEETCANMAFLRGFDFKNRNFGDFSQARGPKNLSWIAVVKAAG
jgi:hypothetical protein